MLLMLRVVNVFMLFDGDSCRMRQKSIPNKLASPHVLTCALNHHITQIKSRLTKRYTTISQYVYFQSCDLMIWPGAPLPGST